MRAEARAGGYRVEEALLAVLEIGVLRELQEVHARRGRREPRIRFFGGMGGLLDAERRVQLAEAEEGGAGAGGDEHQQRLPLLLVEIVENLPEDFDGGVLLGVTPPVHAVPAEVVDVYGERRAEIIIWSSSGENILIHSGCTRSWRPRMKAFDCCWIRRLSHQSATRFLYLRTLSAVTARFSRPGAARTPAPPQSGPPPRLVEQVLVEVRVQRAEIVEEHLFAEHLAEEEGREPQLHQDSVVDRLADNAAEELEELDVFHVLPRLRRFRLGVREEEAFGRLAEEPVVRVERLARESVDKLLEKPPPVDPGLLQPLAVDKRHLDGLLEVGSEGVEFVVRVLDYPRAVHRAPHPVPGVIGMEADAVLGDQVAEDPDAQLEGQRERHVLQHPLGAAVFEVREFLVGVHRAARGHGIEVRHHRLHVPVRRVPGLGSCKLPVAVPLE
eukprot:CAMPEP_0180184126 /NCGR_PEP_ID=MMETSP0986-20121125/41646_1 /TAXON_ID=697907 /ORGANISM="non described non described, Strain CCMP2293" /LENGTH=441 /DNA_ID=CAMNT_0022137767 /DNA_START=98 /DNA_END=1426 /DNA_ORIENTATION=-